MKLLLLLSFVFAQTQLPTEVKEDQGEKTKPKGAIVNTQPAEVKEAIDDVNAEAKKKKQPKGIFGKRPAPAPENPENK